MGILSGALTVRRFRVLGEVPEGFRERYRERLNDYAFRTPPTEVGKEELEGWVQVQNLLDTDFDDLNTWLFDPYAVFALRVDKKVLPAKLLKAHVDKRCAAWAHEHGQDRCPASKRSEIKEALEEEWLKRTLPRVQVTELCWNQQAGYLVLHSLSESVSERVRKRFYQTFGLKIVPWSPLDWFEEEAQVSELLSAAPAAFHGDSP